MYLGGQCGDGPAGRIPGPRGSLTYPQQVFRIQSAVQVRKSVAQVRQSGVKNPHAIVAAHLKQKKKSAFGLRFCSLLCRCTLLPNSQFPYLPPICFLLSYEDPFVSIKCCCLPSCPFPFACVAFPFAVPAYRMRFRDPFSATNHVCFLSLRIARASVPSSATSHVFVARPCVSHELPCPHPRPPTFLLPVLAYRTNFREHSPMTEQTEHGEQVHIDVLSCFVAVFGSTV